MQRRLVHAFVALLALACALQMVSCRVVPQPEEADLAVYPGQLRGVPEVRILVEDRRPEVELQVTGRYTLWPEPRDPGKPSLGEGQGPVTVKVRPTAQGMVLGDPNSPRAQAPYARLRVTPEGDGRIRVDGVDYGGAVVLIRVVPEGPDGLERAYLRVVARVNLEQYMAGVVPHEMPSHWPVEALRAQCVAGRTYALYKIKTRAHLDFDVRDTTASQVWKPASHSNPIINLVVNSTRGIVMSDAFRLFPAYYSAQCGGETKDGADVFISRHIAPLTGVKCPYCQAPGPGARPWALSLSLTEVQRRLNAAGHGVGRVTAVAALDHRGRRLPDDPPARVYDVTVTHDGKGRLLTLHALHFRRALGEGTTGVASTCMALRVRDGTLEMKGRGMGHGVGMCQYGARQMALQKRNYREILQHYYRGNRLVRLW